MGLEHQRGINRTLRRSSRPAMINYNLQIDERGKGRRGRKSERERAGRRGEGGKRHTLRDIEQHQQEV
jgi:hypothetical protein